MKMRVLLLMVLTAAPLYYSAQGLRIYDAQMNDVTGGTVTVTDTSASGISAIFTVINSDTATYSVKAHRIEISVPAGSANNIVWGTFGYPPYVDTTLAPITLTPGAQEVFQGDYSPMNNFGTATFNYCFWDTSNPSIISCVTVVFDNQAVGINSLVAHPVISFGPNPTGDILYMGWGGYTFYQVNIFSVNGELIRTETISPDATEYRLDFSALPEGMYMVQMADVDGYTSNTVIVHQ